jgi:tetratricopeptide (TPR) repeat protein
MLFLFWRGICCETPMIDALPDADVINFGELPSEVNDLLQQGVVAHRNDRARADALFRKALDIAPRELATYYCLYKIHTYMGNLETAKDMALQGMAEAARQAGWDLDPQNWPPQTAAVDGAARFALYTFKALSFIELKRGDKDAAQSHLRLLSTLDPQGSVGWPVIAALAEGMN